MLYLLWGLLNLGLLLFFITTCFKATKLIRETAGLFASAVFVFGLLSFVGHSNNDVDNKKLHSNGFKTWMFAKEDSLNSYATYFIYVDLEETLISKYSLVIKYGNDKQGGINIPISSNSWTSGFVSGTKWKPSSILVNRTDNKNKFKYFVSGIVEWNLLGLTVYSQHKEYKGIAFTK